MKIALISDIHGNYPALKAVLESKAFQSADKAYCLGDLVGYYPYPEECVKRVMKEGIPCVMGNHDYSIETPIELNSFAYRLNPSRQIREQRS